MANVAQDVGDLVNRLVCAANDVPMLVVRHEGHDDGTHKDFLARRFRVLDDIVWLRQNNPYYRNVAVDNAALQALPESGQLTGLLKTTEPALSSERQDQGDTEPEQEGATGGDEHSKTFLRSSTGEGAI